MRDQRRRIVITSAVIRGTGRGWLIRNCGLLADAWNKSLNAVQHRLFPFISPSLMLVFMVIYGFFFFLICLASHLFSMFFHSFSIWCMLFKLVLFPHLGLSHICSLSPSFLRYKTAFFFLSIGSNKRYLFLIAYWPPERVRAEFLFKKIYNPCSPSAPDRSVQTEMHC